MYPGPNCRRQLRQEARPRSLLQKSLKQVCLALRLNSLSPSAPLPIPVLLPMGSRFSASCSDVRIELEIPVRIEAGRKRKFVRPHEKPDPLPIADIDMFEPACR